MNRLAKTLIALGTAAGLTLGAGPALAGPDVPPPPPPVDPYLTVYQAQAGANETAARLQESGYHCVWVDFLVVTNPFDGEKTYEKCIWIKP